MTAARSAQIFHEISHSLCQPRTNLWKLLHTRIILLVALHPTTHTLPPLNPKTKETSPSQKPSDCTSATYPPKNKVEKLESKPQGWNSRGAGSPELENAASSVVVQHKPWNVFISKPIAASQLWQVVYRQTPLKRHPFLACWRLNRLWSSCSSGRWCVGRLLLDPLVLVESEMGW